jgi:hypothetical protein
MAKNYLKETRAFVEDWRRQHGLEGTKILPSSEDVPTYMRPFLKRVSKPNKSKLMIS